MERDFLKNSFIIGVEWQTWSEEYKGLLLSLDFRQLISSKSSN